MAGEIRLMRNYFFDRLSGDSAFRTEFGATNLASRIGQPLAAQGSIYPVVNIRKYGGAKLLRPQNSAQQYILVRQKFLVVAIKDARAYPDALATMMDALFPLQQPIAVTGGRILECVIDEVLGFHETQFTDTGGKTYSEKGTFWEIAAIGE